MAAIPEHVEVHRRSRRVPRLAEPRRRHRRHTVVGDSGRLSGTDEARRYGVIRQVAAFT
jgi:hypothetical protein